MKTPTKDRVNLQVTRSPQDAQRKFGHELANILTPVVGISELLLQRVGETGDPDMTRLAKTLRDSATAAWDLVQRFHEIRAIEHGRRKLTWRAGNLVDLLQSTVRNASNIPAAENVRIELSHGVNDAQVEMDYDLLPGVFHAIIKNAIEHVASESELNERVVQVCLMAEYSDYVIQISNPGTPVSAERIESFFDEFNSDRRRKPSGAGLGTTYARLVTRAHGGHIGVQSSIEDGTVVTISIPKAVD